MPNDGKQLVAGKYRLERIVGQGGMGAVWRAHDEVLGRTVAVKEVRHPPGADERDTASWNARTLREARAAARLRHPGIIAVHDVVQHDGRPWIVMEFVEGSALDALIGGGPPPAPETAARIGARVLDALRAAHAAGVVHRDVKPANILLEGDRVVVTDFGIARTEDDTALTRTGAVLGTPAFMSPEQAAGRAVTPAADLWSLGATLYALVEGRPPFSGPNAAAVIAAILTEEPAPPRRAGPLAPLLAGLLVRDPAGRMTAEQAAAGLAAVAADRPAAPPSAAPPSAAPPFGRPAPGEPPRSPAPAGYFDAMRAAFQGQPLPARPSGATRPARERRARAPWIAAAAVLVAMVLVAGYFALDARNASKDHARLAALATKIGSPAGFTSEGSRDVSGGRLRVDYARHCAGCGATVVTEVAQWLSRQPGITSVLSPVGGCAAPVGCDWQWDRDGSHVQVALTAAADSYSLRVVLG
ncbi:protein kinase domain-containing protein [Actinomadura alba]|nr:serine/threonine-protein kinase [Actinomadura alba]